MATTTSTPNVTYSLKLLVGITVCLCWFFLPGIHGNKGHYPFPLILTEDERMEILYAHNIHRAKVQPQASNMQLLVWWMLICSVNKPSALIYWLLLLFYIHSTGVLHWKKWQKSMLNCAITTLAMKSRSSLESIPVSEKTLASALNATSPISSGSGSMKVKIMIMRMRHAMLEMATHTPVITTSM